MVVTGSCFYETWQDLKSLMFAARRSGCAKDAQVSAHVFKSWGEFRWPPGLGSRLPNLLQVLAAFSREDSQQQAIISSAGTGVVRKRKYHMGHVALPHGEDISVALPQATGNLQSIQHENCLFQWSVYLCMSSYRQIDR